MYNNDILYVSNSIRKASKKRKMKSMMKSKVRHMQVKKKKRYKFVFPRKSLTTSLFDAQNLIESKSSCKLCKISSLIGAAIFAGQPQKDLSDFTAAKKICWFFVLTLYLYCIEYRFLFPNLYVSYVW